MNTAFYIAKRYLFTKSKNNVINLITILASLLIIAVTAVFFILLSGFSGLKDFSLQFYNTSDPDLLILPSQGKTFSYDDKLDSILHYHNIQAFSKVLEQRVFFHYKDKEHIAYLRGVDDHYLQVVKMDTTVFAGNWLQPGMPSGMVAGNGVAEKLSLGIDYIEPVTVYVPKPGMQFNPDLSSMVNRMAFYNTGIFSLIEEIDGAYVFARLEKVQQLLEYDTGRISSIDIAVKKDVPVKQVYEYLQKSLGASYKVITRMQKNAVFYKMLNNENLLLYFISTLLLIMALFNIVGTIIMMIIDKKNNLKTLLNMGFRMTELRKIFVFQGFLLTLAGMLIGLMAGISSILLQKHFAFVKINPVMPYPVSFRWLNVGLVAGTIIVLGYLSAKIAAARINKRLFENYTVE